MVHAGPASLAPVLDVDARGATSERLKVARAITGLRTRTGVDRSHRVRYCAQAIACVRDDPSATVSWRHQWCRDRACPACQRVRSKVVAAEIRRVVDERSEAATLYFVTLTQPRIAGESLATAWDRYDAAWRELRDWMAEIGESTLRGGLRATELAWASGAGWHVHAHTIVEISEDGERVPCPACDGTQRLVSRLKCGTYKTVRCRSCSSMRHPGDGTVPRDIARLITTWVEQTGGSARSQCCVPCVNESAGQLAKYVAAPLADSAEPRVWRELYETAAGRRMHAAWGSWYRVVRLHRRDQGRRKWYPIGAVDALREHPMAMVQWTAFANVHYRETTRDAHRVKLHMMRGSPRRIEGRRAFRPEIALGRMRARDVLAQLAADPRRADEHDELPDDVPRPYERVVRYMSGPQGPWSLRRTGMTGMRGGRIPLFVSDRYDEVDNGEDVARRTDRGGSTGAEGVHAPGPGAPGVDDDDRSDGRVDSARDDERHACGVDHDDTDEPRRGCSSDRGVG